MNHLSHGGGTRQEQRHQHQHQHQHQHDQFFCPSLSCKQNGSCCSTAGSRRFRIRRRRRTGRAILNTSGCIIIIIIVIISIVAIAVVTSVVNTYHSINFNYGTINTRGSGYYYNNKVGSSINTNTNSTINNTSYVLGITTERDDDEGRDGNLEEECWCILWLVPQRWETNYIDDILQLTKNGNKKSSSSRRRRRRSLPICQDKSHSSGNSSAVKRVIDYGNLKEADGLELLGSLSSSSAAAAAAVVGAANHNNIFHNTIIVASIRMGNHTLNTLVLNQVHKLRRRHRNRSDGKTVLFLISEETNPYPNGWTAIITSSYLSRFSFLSNNKQNREGIGIGDGDRPCSNYQSKFNQLLQTTNIDVVLRNYWTSDCTTNTQYHQYQHLHQQEKRQQQPTKYPKIIFVPLLITKMAYSTGYDKYCSSFSSSSHNLFETKHSTAISNISYSNTDQAGYFKFGKSPKDRTTFLYFSSTHVMRHRSSFVDTAMSLAKSSKRRFVRSNNQNNPVFVVNNNHQMKNENSSKDDDGEDRRNRTCRVVLKYPKMVDDVSSNIYHDSKALPNHQQKRAPLEYAEALSDAQYAAVLKGNVDETWRFTESLFCGAIPLLQKSVWEYYSNWLPLSLMSLLPSYSTRHDLKSTLIKLAKQSQAEYESHATAVRSEASEWITNTRDYVLDSIME